VAIARATRIAAYRHIGRRYWPDLCDTARFLLRQAARAAIGGLAAAIGGLALAKPNYQFEKRQRELEKKRKKEEKRQVALAAKGAAAGDDTEAAQQPAAVDSDAPETTTGG